MSEPLKFGIVGCGIIGSSHAAEIATLPDAELAAVTDPVIERAQQLAGRYGVQPYTELAAMLTREELDVVNICTPSGLHGAQACEVMRAGRHVIVEKPMDITLAGADQMLRVQQQAGVKLAVISQRRFAPSSQRLHALLEEGAFGTVVLGNAHVALWRSQAYYDSGAWRGTWKMDGGGILMNQAIHAIDLLCWLMGPVRSVQAYTDTLIHRMETEDVATAGLRFGSGALGAIAATTGAYPGVEERLEIFGDRGSAVLDNDRLAYLRLARDDQGEVGPYGLGPGRHNESSPPETHHRETYASTLNPHALQIADMIRAIRTDSSPLVDGNAARHPVQVILSIYESARTHREVVLA